MSVYKAIGLMSGTSMDGIDVALLKTDGETILEAGPSMEVSYDAAFRETIEKSLSEAAKLKAREERTPGLAALEEALTRKHAEAVTAFLDANEMKPHEIDFLGFHGQTVLHRPESGITVQLGDGAALAQMTGIATVWDLRANDMLHGGQGAPLVPVYHQALAAQLPEWDRGEAVAFVNIGGISNVTFAQKNKPPVAMDCGPGNALIDQWMQKTSGLPFDADGHTALAGMASPIVVDAYMSHPFFAKQAPKSLDRNDFTLSDMTIMSVEDGAATLVRITALAIAASAQAIEVPVSKWIISGGGARNRAIMAHLRGLLGPEKVLTADEAGFSSSMMEAQCWAYLAVRAKKNLPLTFPSTTGCKMPVSGGIISPPR